MRVLLDNCVDRNFARCIAGHEVVAAADIGWGDLENGELLSRAAERFDVMITVDKNIRYQRHLPKLPIPVIEIDAARSRIDELLRFAPHLPEALAKVQRFLFVAIKADGSIETIAERTG